MKCVDWYLSGIARCAWPQANVFYTQLSPHAPEDGKKPPRKLWERYPPELRTRYRVVVTGREMEVDGEVIGLGDTFREAKTNLRRLVEAHNANMEP